MNLPLNNHEAQCARAAFAAMMQHYIEQAEKAQAGVPLRYFSRDQAHTYLDLIRKLDTATDDLSDQKREGISIGAGTPTSSRAGIRMSSSVATRPAVRTPEAPHEVVLPWSHVSDAASG